MTADEVEQAKHYSSEEERFNVASHAVGLFLSTIGLFFLLKKAIQHGEMLHLVSFGIFGISMMMLYAASTAYHSSRDPALRKKLRILDHAAIFTLIAGTYTPLTLLTLQGTLGWTIFGITWGIASAGIILKIFFAGRFKLLSTLMYVLMGWLIIFFIKPLAESFPGAGLYWLIAGGIAYTSGAIIYSIHKISFNHAVFHLFVLLGSICHFIAVYCYVLPVALTQ